MDKRDEVLELQAFQALEKLTEKASLPFYAAKIREYFTHRTIDSACLLQELETLGQSIGLSLRRMGIAKKDFAKKFPANSLLLHNGQLLLLDSLSKGTVQAYSFQTHRTAKLTIEELFGGKEVLPILVYDGALHTFMTRPALHSKDPHGGYGKKPQDAHSIGYEHKDLLSVILSKLFELLKEEKRDFAIVVTYAAIVGILSLIVPLSASAIVNSVVLGVFTNQLVWLCIIVAIGMLIVGAFDVMKQYVVDVLQRRIFIRTAFEIAYRLPRMKQASLENEYPPELINRFFDVLTIQKTVGKFLLDGVSATLVMVIGLFLLAIYHPFFILFNLSLIAFVPILVFVLGRGGLVTSIKESKKKYALASWLEEIGRCQTSFKLFANPDFIYQRVDEIGTEYMKARHKHFMVVARQITGSVVFRAFAIVGVLGIGGSLVIQGQLSIGQLVAAELVIVAMLGSIEKLVSQFAEHYDLLTAIDKLSYLIDKPLEAPRHTEVSIKWSETPPDIRITDVSFSYPDGHQVFNHLSLYIRSGARVSLVGESGAGKTTLASLLVGIYPPSKGLIEFGGYDIMRLSLADLRKTVGIVLAENEIFEGTIEENILMGRHFPKEQFDWALRVAQMYDAVRALPNRLNTMLTSTGNNVPLGLIRRIIFARTIISKPCILILDEAFGGLEERTKLQLIQALYAERCWTIIDISHDAELIRRSETVFVLDKGRICESGSPRELAFRPHGRFAELFPDLVRQVISEKEAMDLADKTIQLRIGNGNGPEEKS
ncbi:MAG: ATP-binding cassette domain-containing protein [Chloroherpetonaceae bacterium]|nr:ATP-binding cassette domain-containing protein [Chloroherpetonaceae bacterium]MCS7212431.1 ATP-binding cassette domain-containing protein [Chloroherpetonaceae bacterium]MDW8019314.1 ATP-binding cassette domain-containing protein [Chloroherpetonaceae bacterium]